MRKIKWTVDKIQKLKELISQKKSALEIANVMGFTKSSILSKCFELKLSLSYNKKINWDENTIKKLINLNDKKKTHIEIANELECSIEAIHRRLSQLKIRSKNVNYFTDYEKEILIKLFEEGKSINYIAGILNRGSPFLCKKAKELGLISKKSKLIQEQLNLKKEGKRKCYKCQQIFPYTQDFFFSNQRACKSCSRKIRKSSYQSLMNNLTAEKLIDIRCRQAYQRSCQKGWEFNITPEYLIEIYKKQNGLCHYSGIKMEIALKGYTSNNYVLSIDRIDPYKGYIKDNIVLCCDAVNTMKMQLKMEEFLKICKCIIDYSHIQA